MPDEMAPLAEKMLKTVKRTKKNPYFEPLIANATNCYEKKITPPLLGGRVLFVRPVQQECPLDERTKKV
tara:strand:+ start:592 stop:798 length:207 start_codon:yes stop_codon:yes gene_type:complete